MGYFSNGSEGMDYEAQYCDKCSHQNGPDGKSGCAVWLAHMLKNYEECNNEDSILHLLISRTKTGNGACLMFNPDRATIEEQKRAEEELFKYRKAMATK